MHQLGLLMFIFLASSTQRFGLCIAIIQFILLSCRLVTANSALTMRLWKIYYVSFDELVASLCTLYARLLHSEFFVLPVDETSARFSG